MKLFGVELKFNDVDVWHKGILTKLSQLTNDTGFITSSSVPTKLSELTNDIGAGGGIKITTSTTAPSSPAPGDFWNKIL